MRSSCPLASRRKGEASTGNKLSSVRCATFVRNDILKRIKEGRHINSQDEIGDSPLHVSVIHGHLDCANLFIKEGADVNVKRNDGYSVLHTAAGRGFTDFTRNLLEHGAIVNAKTEDGETPLHCAVYESKPDCVKLLLEYGASVNAIFGSLATTALHMAAASAPTCIEVLLNGNADVFAVDINGMSPLEIAMEVGLNRFQRVCGGKFNVSNKHGVTPMHLASRSLTSACLELLIRNHCDVNAVTKKGETPLHYVCMIEKAYIIDNVLEDVRVGIQRNIELLLKAGAKVDKKNSLGLTPLHTSVKHKTSITVINLLQHGVDVNIRGGRKKRTALHFASEVGNILSIKFLLENGADKLSVDADNNTALMLAAKKSHFECVRYLLQNDVPLWNDTDNR